MSLSPRTFSTVDAPTDLTGASAPLVVVPWSLFGARRLYVDRADGRHVGWVDLNTGHRCLVMPDLALAFEAAVAQARDAQTPRRALAEAIEFSLMAGLQARDAADVPPPATPAGDDSAVEEPGASMRRAYRGKQAFSAWDLSPCGKRVAADEAGPAAVDARSAYQNSVSAGCVAQVAHLFG